MKKTNKKLLFEMMHKVGGMPLKEFNTEINNNGQEQYQNLINFIGIAENYFTYLHTTDSENNAKSICQNGFRFETFSKTVDYITDVVGLVYMLNIRKPYGNYTIIIQVNSTIENYESISEKSYDEDENEVFILPPQYIKGYYNRTTNVIVPNSLFKE